MDVRFELIAALEEFRGKRVLDVGCGPGIHLAEVDEGNLRIGIDDSFARLQTAKMMCAKGIFIRADVFYLLFREASFDVVVLGGVIELVEDKVEIVRAFYVAATDQKIAPHPLPSRADRCPTLRRTARPGHGTGVRRGRDRLERQGFLPAALIRLRFSRRRPGSPRDRGADAAAPDQG